MKSLLKCLLLFLLLFGAVHQEVEAQKKKKKDKGAKKDKKKKGSKSSASDKKRQKAEGKQWKKKLSKLTPGQYKKLMGEYYSLKDRVSTAEEEALTCQSSIEDKNSMLSRYQEEISKLRKQTKEGASFSGRNIEDVRGVTFRVQIGAYSSINLGQYSGQENFNVENAAEMQKFSVGLFKSYREADALKRYLQQMGLKDAWVVAYRDGSRVDMKEVLNQASAADTEDTETTVDEDTDLFEEN